MSEEDEEESEPAVELGSGPDVEGAPLSRVAARQTWPKEKSEILERDGDALIRSADGPIALSALLADVEDTYFSSQRHFIGAVEEHLPQGPVETVDG